MCSHSDLHGHECGAGGTGRAGVLCAHLTQQLPLNLPPTPGRQGTRQRSHPPRPWRAPCFTHRRVASGSLGECPWARGSARGARAAGGPGTARPPRGPAPRGPTFARGATSGPSGVRVRPPFFLHQKPKILAKLQGCSRYPGNRRPRPGSASGSPGAGDGLRGDGGGAAGPGHVATQTAR